MATSEILLSAADVGKLLLSDAEVLQTRVAALLKSHKIILLSFLSSASLPCSGCEFAASHHCSVPETTDCIRTEVLRALQSIFSQHAVTRTDGKFQIRRRDPAEFFAEPSALTAVLQQQFAELPLLSDEISLSVSDDGMHAMRRLATQRFHDQGNWKQLSPTVEERSATQLSAARGVVAEYLLHELLVNFTNDRGKNPEHSLSLLHQDSEFHLEGFLEKLSQGRYGAGFTDIFNVHIYRRGSRMAEVDAMMSYQSHEGDPKLFLFDVTTSTKSAIEKMDRGYSRLRNFFCDMQEKGCDVRRIIVLMHTKGMSEIPDEAVDRKLEERDSFMRLPFSSGAQRLAELIASRLEA